VYFCTESLCFVNHFVTGEFAGCRNCDMIKNDRLEVLDVYHVVVVSSNMGTL